MALDTMVSNTTALDTMSWFQSVKQNKHIFIYSVCGRARSTFLQRVINSSNQAFILGEHHYLIDDLCQSIWTMMLINKALGVDTQEIDLPSYTWMKHVKDSNSSLQLAIAENSHDKWYPNAMGSMTNSIELVSQAVGELLHPFTEGYERFGFKEIRLKDINVLNVLKWLFPNAMFVFVFREPSSQWHSISQFTKSFDYSNSLKEFSQEYKRLANLYIDFCRHNPSSCLFIGEKSLLDLEALETVLKHIGISSFQENLLSTKVGFSSDAKSRYSYMHFYRNLKQHIRAQAIHSTLKQQGVYDVYLQLQALEYQ